MSVFTSEVIVDSVGGTVQVDSSTLAKDTSVLALTKPSDTQLVDGSAHPQPVTGPLTDTQLRATPVPISGTVTALVGVGSTATITRVATSTSSALLLAANANRKKAVIMTETGTTNYVAFAATATSTAYTYLLGTNSVLEITNYTGAISLIRSSGSGNVQVTEIV